MNGLEPSLTAVQVLVWAAALSRGSKPALYRSYRPDDLLEILARPGGSRVYVTIHNIDGPALRSPGSQRLLSRLAAVPGVHLAASIDHVNAPLIWDLQTRDRFRWSWYHTPTFAPYIEEVAFAAPPALLAGRREDGAQRGALIVLSSLSQNARHVFRLMALEQLSPGGEQGGKCCVCLFGKGSMGVCAVRGFAQGRRTGLERRTSPRSALLCYSA